MQMNENPLQLENVQRPLFDAFPGLRAIPCVPLMDGAPTPVHRLAALSGGHPGFDVFVKRDDLTSSIYGGNKPRKFEFLFGDALAKKKTCIHTAGGTGTNHGLATALFCKALGLRAKIYMFNQPLTWSVQRKLLVYPALGAELELVPNYAALAFKGLGQLLFHRSNHVMLPGGSPLFGLGTVLGCLGFVNAAFELKAQVDAGMLPEPDHIFIPAGSTGSAAGLVLGCALAGMKTRVVAVQVSESIVSNAGAIEKNARKTLALMRSKDASVPGITISRSGFDLVPGYLGSAYGCVTCAAQAAVDKVAALEGHLGFHLETTYTGKACAAMLDHMTRARDAGAGGGTILFWNTYNSRDLTPLVRDAGFRVDALPPRLRPLLDQALCCWQLKDCPGDVRAACNAYLAEENRCWLVKGEPGGCDGCDARRVLEQRIKPES